MDTLGLKKIPEKSTTLWKMIEDNAVIKYNANQYILNDSAAIVWNMIDGVISIEEIVNNMLLEYGESNSREAIIEVVKDTLNSLSENGFM